MRRQTEIGIIAGIVMAIIIGVFISTRTVVKEPTIPLSHTYEGESTGDEALDLGVLTQQLLPEISELPEERPRKTIPAVPSQAIGQKEEGDVVEDEWGDEVAEAEMEDEVVEGEWEEIEPPPTTVVEEIEPGTKPAPAEAIHAEEDIVYKVKPNDTLSKLARQFYGDESKWGLIYDANIGEISHRNALYVGQEIVIPSVSAIAEKPTAVESLPSPPPQAGVAPEEARERTHTVQKGDTLIKLARRYYNNEADWKKIYNANKNTIPNPNAVSQGTVLIIPE